MKPAMRFASIRHRLAAAYGLSMEDVRTAIVQRPTSAVAKGSFDGAHLAYTPSAPTISC